MKVLLIGDNCIDEYHYGEVKRISPEAPIPIFDFISKEERSGMGINVMNNLEKLGCEVVFLTTGSSKKTRLVDIKSKQHIVRIDHDPVREPVEIPKPEFLNEFDCIVISDYNKGSVDYSIKNIRSMYDKPIFIDTKKKNLHQFKDFFIKINLDEYKNSSIYGENFSLLSDNVIVTCGEKGAIYKDELYDGFSVEVFDVCGAGDTFLSALAFSYTYTNNMQQSIIFANAAASITVKHIGVYAPSLTEIERVLKLETL